MSYDIKQSSTAYPLVFLMVDSTDHVTAKTGLSPTVTISKAGASFASPSGSVTEIGSGWYKVAGNATDTNTLGPLILHATGTAADPVDILYNVVVYDPQDTVRLGLTALPNVASGNSGAIITAGTGTGQLSVTSGRATADVTYFGGAAGTFSSGRAEVNMTHIAGSSVSTSTAQLGVNVVNFGGSAGTFASGRPEVNTSHIAGSSVSTSTAQIGVNVVNFGGSAGTFASGIPEVKVASIAANAITATAINADAITAAKIADGAIDAATFSADALGRLGVITYGTAQSATATTIVLASATSFTDDYLIGATIYIVSGTGAGQRALITDWVNSTDTATVDTWLTTPDNTSVYVVFATPPSSSSSPIGVNVIQVSGDSTAADTLELFAEALDQSTGQIDSGSFQSGAITSTAFASSAITSTVLAASCIGSSQLATGCITSNEISASGGNAIAGYIFETAAASYVSAGSFGKAINDILDDTGTSGVVLASGSITASVIATDAIDADSLKADAVTEIQSGLATASALSTVSTNVSAILDDTGTSGVIVASIASGAITASAIATDAIDVNEISAAACNKIADHVRRRTQANVEASSYGDTLSVGSEYGLIQQAQESNTTANAGKLTVFKTDGTTELAQRPITTDDTAEPITGIS